MSKSRTFLVNEGRMFFMCPSCKSRKTVPIAPGLRRKSVCCQKCGEKTSCTLNRRRIGRNCQSGLVLLLVGGEASEVNLLDVSMNGVGLEMNFRSKLKLSVGREVQLKCNWNPLLFSQKGYIVKSVRGFKIGLERRT